MYNSPYEEYMRNSLGYNQIPMNEIYEMEGNFTCNQISVEDMYPEIYRIIYPMICKCCMAVNENITEDLVSRITNEVYMNVEHMEVVQENRNTYQSSINSKNIKNDSTTSKVGSNITSEVRQENRQRNPLLRDLIRILVLRELIGNPGQPRPRPPFNPPGRPPFGPGPRPPFGY